VARRTSDRFRTPFDVIEVPGTDGFLAEALEFKTLIESREGWNGASADESHDISKILDAILQSARGTDAGSTLRRTKCPKLKRS